MKEVIITCNWLRHCEQRSTEPVPGSVSVLSVFLKK